MGKAKQKKQTKRDSKSAPIAANGNRQNNLNQAENKTNRGSGDM